MTSFTQVIPWAFKLCLAKVTGPSLLYVTVGYVYTVNRCCLERLHGWVFWQLLTALALVHLWSSGSLVVLWFTCGPLVHLWCSGSLVVLWFTCACLQVHLMVITLLQLLNVLFTF